MWIFVFQNPAHRNALVAERFDQQAAGLVVAHDADGQNIDVEVGEIIDGIGTAARNDRSLAMLEDQHGRFARDAGDFAVDEFVGDQVGEHGDGDFGKRLKNFLEAIGFFGMLGHPAYTILSCPVLSLANDPQHGIDGVSGVEQDPWQPE